MTTDHSLNQHQKKVETGAIQWLEAAVHILLDIKKAPEFSWFLALKYLATIHKYTLNDEQQCIPETARDGKTYDISHLLQFTFWERVLYLENNGNFPSTGKHPGYFCGFSDNDGDSLTFQVYDDQN